MFIDELVLTIIFSANVTMQYALFRQSGALAQRYGAVLLGDPFRMLLFLCQVAFIVGVLLLTQHYASIPSHTLMFWLPLAVFWCGGFAACQEIVRERAIFRREQMIGVTIPAYLLSKYRLLSIVVFLQTALLILILSAEFPFSDHLFFWWLFAYLFALVGVAFGLLVSAVTPNRLTALLATGSFAIAHVAFFYYAIAPGMPFSMLKYTPVGMGYLISHALMAAEPEMFTLFAGIGILCLWGGICGMLTMLLLRRANS
ncbi:ABC transporter, ATP-binding protein [Candidatus Moduliflexus flocculans]|uniref:ABC transporter, ATP-binding protein n=1 Tax=Candidatus Moduliflexus flocculans TaxID=1499966 RepID=A0A081BNG3_9BACT|nr:ABC transporter, ATP-binding protein [Candidatus Moduliflexus flocculans]